MNFETIETSRLHLKGVSPDQMKYIFNNLSKSEIKNILGHRTEEDFLKEEYKHINGYSCYNRSFMLFLLTYKESDRIIGRCGLHNWNIEHNRAEIGYIMEEDSYKRKGLMTEAVKAVIDYGFRKRKLNRIEALVGVGNIPSLRLMEKFHFIQEGVLKQHYHITDNYVDSVLFSKLYKDYINESNTV